MIIAVLIILGLCFGSFVNALVWRLHEQDKPKKKRAASDDDLSIVKGRSMCPHCKHTLAASDLLPLFSWLFLGGKCRYCRKPIGWQYPLVEAATAVLFVASYLWWPQGFDNRGIFELAIWLVALVAFMALIVYDLRWMLLPNKIVFPLTGLAIFKVFGVAILFGGGVHSILNALFGLLIAGGIFYVLFQVSDGKWIGGGDVKLGFALGLLLGGPTLAMLMLFVASLLGTLVALPGLLAKRLKRTSVLPFGPFLILGTMITMLFGTALITWYEHRLDVLVTRLFGGY